MSEEKIELAVSNQTNEVFAVKLPIYRKYTLGGRVIYTRINKGFSAVSVEIDEDNQQYTLHFMGRYRFDTDSPVDFHLGRGQYASSQAEFETALDMLKAAADTV